MDHVILVKVNDRLCSLMQDVRDVLLRNALIDGLQGADDVDDGSGLAQFQNEPNFVGLRCCELLAVHAVEVGKVGMGRQVPQDAIFLVDVRDHVLLVPLAFHRNRAIFR